MLEHIAQLISAEHSTIVLIGLKLGIIAAVFLPIISVVALFSIWWERKVAGHIQSRVGPMHVGKWHGWAQTLADGIKLILKEDLVPRKADGFLYRFAPYMAFAPVFAAFIALPFGPQFVFEAGLNIGVLYVLAVLSVEVMSTIMAGWGSNSKWSVYGAMREACQMVSYEIPLGVSIIIGVLVAGTLNMVELGHLQAGGLFDWLIFHNPFIFASFLIYFIASLASNKRAPFDLPESESELVAGYLTEYSGLRWSLFFLAEYNAMFIVGAIQATLFLGGWNSPFGSYDPIYALIGYDPIATGQAYFDGTLSAGATFNAKAEAINNVKGGSLTGVGLIIANAYGAFWFVSKAFLTIFVQMWLRWTLPRIRIDQVLYSCVKVLLPASLILLVLTAMWLAIVPQAPAGLVTANRTANVVTVNVPAPPAPAKNTEGDDDSSADSNAKTKAGKSDEAEATVRPAVPIKLDIASFVDIARQEQTDDQASRPAATHLKISGVTGGHLLVAQVKGDEVKHWKVRDRIEIAMIDEPDKGEMLFFQPDAVEPVESNDDGVAPAEATTLTLTFTGAIPHVQLGHLTQPTPLLQMLTQLFFGAVGVLILIACVAVMVPGWAGILFKGGAGQPPKSLFPDIMPVGRDIAFTTMPRPAEPEPAAE